MHCNSVRAGALARLYLACLGACHETPMYEYEECDRSARSMKVLPSTPEKQLKGGERV